jgi:asparagine synthase (glutamine-hydrolysing)
MSGILCVHHASGIPQHRPVYLAALRRLSHRGPHGEASTLGDTLFLGVRRSSVGPGSAGEQPLTSADGTVTAALDGHLHNRQTLAHGLRARGGGADLSSDTALVLALYAEHGEQLVERLRGVWALVVWDARDRRLVVGRDALGVRPLYYFLSGRHLIVASEIKSILDLDHAARDVNHDRLRDLLRDGLIDDWTGTCFAQVRPVPPATVLRFQDGRLATTTRYWSLRPSTDRRLGPHDVLDTLVAAVERHTPGGVRVGLALSGGIDSSSLAGILARPSLRHARDVHAFSITPPHTADESFLVDATIRRTGLPHTHVPLAPLDYPQALARLVESHDEPLHASGAFYQFVLRQRMAEAGCGAVLVGYGADEIFGGYRSLAPAFLLALVQSGRLREAARFVRGAREFLEVSDLLRRAGVRARAAMVRAGRRIPAVPWNSGTCRSTSRPDAADYGLDEIDLHDVDEGRPFFRALLGCFRRNIPLLVRQEDRNAMAHGLDLCAPFMDEELVQTALSFPFAAYMRGGWNKAVLREATHELLAPEVRAYTRKLMTPGSDAYVAFDVLRAEFLDLLSSPSFYDTGLWSRRCRQMYEADAAMRTRGHLWFRIFVVHQWYERVVRATVR